MVLRPSLTKRIPNPFLRKSRRSPNSPFNTQWHYSFNQLQALQSLKQSITLLPSPPNSQKALPFLLNSLIHSFSAYNCHPTPEAYHFIIKTLIQNSQFSEIPIVLSYFQNVKKFETPERVFVDLIKGYGGNGMVVEAVDLFLKIPNFRCVPTAISLNALLLVLCRDRECLRFVPQLIMKCKDMNIRIEESSFEILISALCRIGKVDYGIKLLGYMVDEGFDPGDKICSFILASVCRQKGVTSFDVMGVLEGMRRIGFCPGRVDFMNMIGFLVREGKGGDAFGVLVDMKRAGIRPDIVCYTMVLHGLVELGEFRKVEDLFDEILVFGFVPDVRTYNVYISGLCKQEKVDSAYMMINGMEQLGCQPDLVTYRTILEGFCNVRELQRAKEVWNEMKRKAVGLDAQTYSIMIEALLREGEIAEACSLLDEMLSNNVTPTVSMLDNIISSLCRGGLILEALGIVEKVCSRDVVPGSRRAWEALVLSLECNVGDEMVLLANLASLHGE